MHTVLLVLQSEDFRLILQDALKDRYRVLSAKNAKEGTALLLHWPNILLLDLFLPGTDGITFLEQNRPLLPSSILLFTTLANPVILNAALELGVKSVFLKPCSLTSVQNWVDTQV